MHSVSSIRIYLIRILRLTNLPKKLYIKPAETEILTENNIVFVRKITI